MLSSPLSLDIDLFGGCNLSCSYCDKIQQNAIIPSSIITKLIDNIYDNGLARILFGGGEPTLRSDWLKIVSYACNKPGLNVTLVTNGTIWSEEQINVLSNLPEPPTISISLDGHLSEIHSATRSHKNNRQNQHFFNKIINSIKLCKQCQLLTTVNTVINKYNYRRIEEIVSFVETLDVDRLLLIKQTNLVPSTVKKYSEDLNQWNETVLKVTKIKEGSNRFTSNISALVACPWELLLPLIYNRYDTNEINTLWGTSYSTENNTNEIACSAGKTHCYIDASGNVYPCSIVPPSPISSLLAGNIIGQDFLSIWNNSRVLVDFRNLTKNDLTNNCSTCLYFHLCKGGCRVRSVLKSKGMTSPDPDCPVINKLPLPKF